jgi:hypothetical protein
VLMGAVPLMTGEHLVYDEDANEGVRSWAGSVDENVTFLFQGWHSSLFHIPND